MIEVLNSGLFTSIQDLGRYGFRKYGVPVSGAMDQYATIFANQSVGNHPRAAVLEFAFSGPILRFTHSAKICLSGAVFNAQINGQATESNQLITVKAGDLLKIGSAKKGVYGYLAISGGFKADFVLESYSYYAGICDKNRIKRGDILHANPTLFSPDKNLKFAKIHARGLLESEYLNVSLGPEFDSLSTATRESLFSTAIRVSSDINRMGYRLDSAVSMSAQEIITAPVQPGTVQLTPSGKLIALMRDGQTTGGYARILQLSNKAMAILAHKRTGDTFHFRLKPEEK